MKAVYEILKDNVGIFILHMSQNNQCYGKNFSPINPINSFLHINTLYSKYITNINNYQQ